MNYYDWKTYFTELQKSGRYTFTLTDLKKQFNISEESLLQGLYYHKKAKRIVQIRQEFYGILSPYLAINGTLPVYSFLDDLMKSLDKPYYLALINAAALHGAAHQQPMVDYVITMPPAPRSIINKKMKLFFVAKKSWNNDYIVRKKTQTGAINVSSPELTALDLITYSGKFGLNYVTTILTELYEAMKSSQLKKVASEYGITSSIQRLGYILDRVINAEKLASVLYNTLLNKNIRYIPLSAVKVRTGIYDNKWKVIVNTEIEPDLW